jgi:hypothetical protein
LFGNIGTINAVNTSETIFVDVDAAINKREK